MSAHEHVAGGLLISVEGGEGAGKSTQIARLRQTLLDEGYDPVLVREPGGTLTGEAVRSILLDPETGPTSPRAELFLYLAARAELTDRIIVPALDAGRVVICDRFIDASVAYQGGGRGLGRDRVEPLNRFATGDRIPELTVLLDLDPREGLRRASGRGPLDRLEQEAVEFHDRVRHAYLDLADQSRFLVLDAREPVDVLASAISVRVLSHIRDKR